jgi:hypothetical protein
MRDDKGACHSISTLKGQHLHQPWLDKVHQECEHHDAERRGQFTGLTFPLCCYDHISCWLPRNTP